MYIGFKKISLPVLKKEKLFITNNNILMNKIHLHKKKTKNIKQAGKKLPFYICITENHQTFPD